MVTNEKQRQIIEDTGAKYNEIIFEEDFIPKTVYQYQIGLRNKIINQTFNRKRFGYVLDLGCGTGFHQKTLSNYAEILIGADMSFAALKECKKYGSGEYVVCDINHLPFKSDSMDCIWIAGVLHHIPENLPTAIKDNIYYVLKRGGVILIDEPNRYNPLTHLIIRMSKADPTGNERPLSVNLVEKILRQSHLKILYIDFYELFGPFGLLVKSRSLFRFCVSIDRLLGKGNFKKFLLRWTIFAMKE